MDNILRFAPSYSDMALTMRIGAIKDVKNSTVGKKLVILTVVKEYVEQL